MLSTLSGRIQIRAAGLVMLGFLSCIVTAILTHYLKLANGGGTPSRSVPYVAMCVATCLTASTSGALMLLKPRWWFEKYWASGLFDEQQRRTLLSIRAIRIVGALFFVGGVYMAWLSL